MLSFLKVKGIRRRWLISSVGVLVLILAVVVATFSLIMKSYYDSGILSDMESKARAASGYFETYVGAGSEEGDYLTAAQDYVSSFTEGSKLELQFLTPGGTVLYSSNGLTLSGTVPATEDITRLQTTGKVSSFRGTAPQTGERITAVSAPLAYNGELMGIMRYETSMRLVDRQVLMLTLAAAGLCLLILVLVYLSNGRFVRSIVDPVQRVTAVAQRIAAGSYGIQVEKRYDDEVGELTDAINDMSQKIKQAESMKSDFISSVSHELRTPLTAITGWAETIMNGEARDASDIRKGMGIIASESGSRVPISITAAMPEGIVVHHTDCEDMLPPIPGDPDRLRQVFCNLLDNAAKHGGSGGRIETAIYPEDGDVVITVRDFGPGIPPEELPNVKYKFYKGSSTARGSGIGLAVCEEIVSLHNGELTIKNAEDDQGGCLAEIRLPMGT